MVFPCLSQAKNRSLSKKILFCKNSPDWTCVRFFFRKRRNMKIIRTTVRFRRILIKNEKKEGGDDSQRTIRQIRYRSKAVRHEKPYDVQGKNQRPLELQFSTKIVSRHARARIFSKRRYVHLKYPDWLSTGRMPMPFDRVLDHTGATGSLSGFWVSRLPFRCFNGLKKALSGFLNGETIE